MSTIDGIPVTSRQLRSSLAELGGAQALEDAVLDAALDRLLLERNVGISADQVEREHDRLLAAIADESGLNQAQADQALARIRGSRGLGPVRMRQLLERNAKLRALVAGSFDPTPEERLKALELARGPKATAILVLVKDEKEASLIRAGLLGPPGPDIERVSEMARARSLDSSAHQGGRLGPINPKDPRVPSALRAVLETLPPGEVSPVIAMDEGFAIVMIESRTEALPITPELEAKIDSALLAKHERLAMERLARRLLSEADVRVSDPSLRWSWERRRTSVGDE